MRCDGTRKVAGNLDALVSSYIGCTKEKMGEDGLVTRYLFAYCKEMCVRYVCGVGLYRCIYWDR